MVRLVAADFEFQILFCAVIQVTQISHVLLYSYLTVDTWGETGKPATTGSVLSYPMLRFYAGTSKTFQISRVLRRDIAPCLLKVGDRYGKTHYPCQSVGDRDALTRYILR